MGNSLAKPGADADRELVERFRGGERRAFNELVRRYQKPVYYMALRYVKNDADAADVTQKAFVRAYKAIASFRGDSSFKTWITRIAINQAINYLRDNKREKATDIDDLRDDALIRNPTGAHRVIRNEESAALRDAVERLPDKQRMVLSLRIYEELPFREIAELVRCSENSAKVNFSSRGQEAARHARRQRHGSRSDNRQGERAMTRLNPEELLAAYADGGLNHTEREAVEAYLEDNPGARSELDGIRSMLTRVRENPPEPASEPSWAAMSVAINEATGQTTGETTGEAEAAPAGFAARLQAWFDGLSRPRLVMGGLAMAAAAVILFALATGWPGADDNGDGRGPGVAQDDMRAPLVDEVDEVDEADELERALDEALDDALARDEDAPGENPHTDTELPEIDDDEVVDALFEALDPEVIAPGGRGRTRGHQQR